MRIVTPSGEQRETNRFVEADPGNEEVKSDASYSGDSTEYMGILWIAKPGADIGQSRFCPWLMGLGLVCIIWDW